METQEDVPESAVLQQQELLPGLEAASVPYMATAYLGGANCDGDEGEVVAREAKVGCHAFSDASQTFYADEYFDS
jgi:hypothetical protein